MLPSGAPVGRRTVRVLTLTLAAVAVAGLLAGAAAAAPDDAGDDDTHVVCPAESHDHPGNPSAVRRDGHHGDECEYHDVQRAVNEADDGDTVYLRPGTYYQNVTVRSTANLTLAGAGRDETFLVTPHAAEHDHGDNESGGHHETTYDGVYVSADNVTVRDLEVRGFGGDGVYYAGVVDFRVTRVDAVDNGAYGIYAIRSTLGTFEDSYAEGHYDSGFYLGEVNRCECVIRNVTAAENLIGYSGTGAGYIHIVNSTWRDNAAGIVPNVLPNEPAYQTNLEARNNLVVNNNNRTAFRNFHFAGSLHAPLGTGVIIGGGSFNTVEDNVIRNHSYAGVMITYMFTEPSGNAVIGNEFEANALDVWWDGGGANNCFSNNDGSNGSVSFDAGAYWNARGSLPDCDGTPNAGAPDPQQLAEVGSLVVYGCYPSELPDGERCHVEEPDPHVHPPAAAGFSASADEAAELLFGPADLPRPDAVDDAAT